MMPKGVEHVEEKRAGAAGANAVKIPMMPKGVEHTLLGTVAVGLIL